MKARKGRLRFISPSWGGINGEAVVRGYKSAELNNVKDNFVYVKSTTAVIILGPHTKMYPGGRQEHIYVQVLSCVGIVWLEMCDLSDGPDPQ